MTIEESKLMENEEFLMGLVKANTPMELEDVLKKNNIQLEDGLTSEDALKIVKDAKNSELSENDLENVSGGFVLPALLLLSSVGYLVLGGSAIAFFAGYGYQKLKNIWGKKG